MILEATTFTLLIAATVAATFSLAGLFRAGNNRSITPKLRDSHEGGEQLRAILNNINDGAITIDPHGMIRMFNPIAANIFGYQEDEVVGKNISMLLTDIRTGEDGAINTEVREAVGVRKSGATFQAGLNVFKVENKDDPELVVITRYITERRQAEQRLIFLSQYDALTALPTRTLFHDRANQALARARREDKLVAIMYLDLDNFKSVNDSLGHDAGDQMLKAVVQRITSCLRDVDTVSRRGGDEFAIILESLPHIDYATIAAQKILDVMQQPFHLEGHDIYVTVSIGITIYPFDDKDLNNLLRDADQAMYRVKQAGCNSYQFFSADMAKDSAAVQFMEARINHALQHDELLLHYQPRVDLSQGKIMGVEALLRWQHPEMGLIAAKDFMPLLERSRLVYSVDEWVLRTACLQNYQWRKIGLPPLRMTVHISPNRFRYKGIVELVARVLKDTGLPPDCLELNIPAENLVGMGKENYHATLRALSALGVHIALADYTSGNSIIDQLRRLPLDVMKIDRSFVRDASMDQDHADMQAIVAMARALKLKVVAEGVETEEQLELLRHYGCDLIQGFLFSKPVSAEELARLLREGKRLN